MRRNDTMTPAQAITKAKKLAKARNVVMAVVEIDQGDGRVVAVVDNDYTYGAEYDAFNGHLIVEVAPCGAVQGEW